VSEFEQVQAQREAARGNTTVIATFLVLYYITFYYMQLYFSFIFLQVLIYTAIAVANE